MHALAIALLALLQVDAKPSARTAEDVRATLTADPREVEVGEPVTLVLELEHPADATPVLPGEDLGLGGHWAVLESVPGITLPAPGDVSGTRLVTRKRWTVVVLAPTDVLPSIDVPFKTGPEGLLTFSVLTPEGSLSVASVLGQTATTHRPIKGFQDELPETREERVPWWAGALGATAVLLLAAWLWRGRARAARRPAPVVTPLERLAQLEGSVSDDLPALQALHYSLTSLLREATDRHLGRALFAATDAEWIATTQDEEHLPSDVRAGLVEILARSEEVKYARHKPTRWAVDETLGAAKKVLQEVGGFAGRGKRTRGGLP